jgi:HAD superfamily hydrolase (TIGR01509 family)
VTTDAVIFDLDGVLVDSESVWDEVRRDLTLQSGGRWSADAQRRMMGMSSTEWARFMHDELGVRLEPDEISRSVVAEMVLRYQRRLPLIDGAADAVRRLGGRWPLGLASSANRPLIDLFLARSGLAELFGASVSSEEVKRGKPAPDVYLRTAELLGVRPAGCAAVEDSSNGLRAASAAGMRVIAIPNAEFPPVADALDQADVILPSIAELLPETVAGLATG